MEIDAASSSSLVAVHQAVAGLQRGEAGLALAGGVQAFNFPIRLALGLEAARFQTSVA